MEQGSCSVTAAGGSCCGKIIKGAILGGLVMFIWFSVSWHFLPWHANSLMGFKNEAEVAGALAKSDSGVYVIPWTNMGQVKQATDKPFAFVSVFAPGVDVKGTMVSMMISAFVMSVVMAGLLSCLLSKKVEGFCPVLFSVKTGLLVGVAAFAPNYIFYHFPVSWTLTGIADEVIAFGLTGAIVGRGIFKMKLGMNCGQGACGPSACGEKTHKK